MKTMGLPVAALVAVAALLASPRVAAQGRAGGPSGPARSVGAIDLTGYWVAYVTEDWRYRMMTPPRGDYRGVPTNDAARKVAAAWDPAADAASGNECKAFGAAAIMRLPGRFHITWQDDNTLRIDTDAGSQTRLLHFDAARQPPAARTWQGHSIARWGRGGGSLTVVTRNMREGYLRPNGVPYSEDAVLTEHLDVAPLPGGGQVLLLTSIVEDPRYLQQPYFTSVHFKKEADGTKWDPTPCTATW